MIKRKNKRKDIVYIKRGVYVPGYKRKEWPKWLAIITLILALSLLSYWLLNKDTQPTLKVNNTKTDIPSGVVAGEKTLLGPYKVVKVIDGDTVDLSINGKSERIRLIGMDTPEIVDPRKPVQCFGLESSNKAKEILDGKSVYIEKDSTQSDRDKYNRLLRYIYTDKSTNYSIVMIREGYAFEYTYEIPYKYQSEFKQAQTYARDNTKGLWAANTCTGKAN